MKKDIRNLIEQATSRQMSESAEGRNMFMSAMEQTSKMYPSTLRGGIKTM